MSSLSTASPNNPQLSVMIDQNYVYRSLWGLIHGVFRIEAIFMELAEGITETATVQYDEEHIVGRASSILSFMGVSARQIPLTFRFHVQGRVGSTGGDTDSAMIAEAIRDEVLEPVKFLEALKYPVVDEMGLAHAPPPVILTIGRLAVMRAVVHECQVTWQAPWLIEAMLPYGADVQVTFAEVQPLVGNFAARPDLPRRWLPAIPIRAVDISFGKVS